ncbi:uncharacterized protein LOC114442559 isoform X2 [Parambassis ranga]|uniref:Uncharacterized protein LOC114442559 isoform X2 n=1 Tax=Parambassis ranga TaxID=210632 RepID=A0A6P7J623_9TELE|nr:uncharacterized protein LOC114442559 isoform X2 [Parambassis ranga]
MLIILFVALLFPLRGYADIQRFVTKTVYVGEDVTLRCSRRSESSGFMFWNKLVAGNLPEVLGATYTFDQGTVNKTPHITARQEPGTFILHITQTQLSDTAFYYCQEILELQTTLLNITLLSVKGHEPDITAVIQDVQSNPVHPGDPVTLQCSVLSDSDPQMCAENHSVLWFRAGSDGSHPSVIYVHGNSGDNCERSPDAHSQQKCVYNFSRNSISSSDEGTYYCAVAACGQIFFGNGAKVDFEANCQGISTFLFLLSVALVISLIVIALLIYNIKKHKCLSAAVALQQSAGTSSDDQQQTNEDLLVYSMPNFTRKKVSRNVRRGAKSGTEEQSVYAGVRILGYEE